MYEEYFGLTKKPFQLSPDASFFFPSAEHSKALSFLQYGLSQGDGFIVITGNVGTVFFEFDTESFVWGSMETGAKTLYDLSSQNLQVLELVNVSFSGFS